MTVNGQVQRLQKVDHGANYNDNDNDHSSSQLRVHEALTCPEGQVLGESQETIKGNCSTLTIEPYSKPRQSISQCRKNSLAKNLRHHDLSPQPCR